MIAIMIPTNMLHENFIMAGPVCSFIVRTRIISSIISISAIKLESFGIESDGDRNILASIIVSFMYAASLGFTLLVILSAIWGQYIKLRFSGDFYASYDKAGMIVVIAVMAVTAIGCFVRDRLELV